MVRILVVYDSRTGNTEEMAKSVAEGVRKAGAEVVLKRADDVSLEDMKRADGIILGSPTHFGTMSDRMKALIDESVRIRGDLDGKIGACFSSSAHYAGGNETTLLSLIKAMLIHGMIVAGDPLDVGGHYGVVSVGKPDAKTLEACEALGRRVVEIAGKLK
ncbi:MAG: NAD(P)H-dependent oxidoreductase [Canidatus Methanoxibalbensis ujae]|nr:NAD(P)H-dependent oxidoreductase [Candidatus Methanoxibalbensis ujae]